MINNSARGKLVRFTYIRLSFFCAYRDRTASRPVYSGGATPGSTPVPLRFPAVMFPPTKIHTPTPRPCVRPSTTPLPMVFSIIVSTMLSVVFSVMFSEMPLVSART